MSSRGSSGDRGTLASSDVSTSTAVGLQSSSANNAAPTTAGGATPAKTYVLDLDGLRSIVADHPPRFAPAHGTIVLMASMLIRPRSYSRLVQRLSKTSRVVTIEPPGSGRASRLDQPWTFEQYARQLLRTLEALDLRGVILIGHSNSAAVAMLAAGLDDAAAPRVARVILADSVGADPRHGFWRIGLGRLLDGVFEAGFSITALFDIFWNLIVHNANFLGEIDQAINWDATPHAPRVRVPALVIWGGRDLTFLPWVGRRLHAMIPASRFFVFPPGHHDWLATNPTEFAAAVEHFIDTTAANSTAAAAARANEVAASDPPAGQPA